MRKRGRYEGGKKSEIKVVVYSSLFLSTHNMHRKQAKRGDENFMRELNHIKCDGMGILCKAQAEYLAQASSTNKIPRTGISIENYREIFQNASSAQEPTITRYVCNTFQKVLLPSKYR